MTIPAGGLFLCIFWSVFESFLDPAFAVSVGVFLHLAKRRADLATGELSRRYRSGVERR